MISKMSPQGRFLSDDGVRKVPRRDCRVSTTLVTLECSGEVRSLLQHLCRAFVRSFGQEAVLLVHRHEVDVPDVSGRGRLLHDGVVGLQWGVHQGGGVRLVLVDQLVQTGPDDLLYGLLASSQALLRENTALD